MKSDEVEPGMLIKTGNLDETMGMNVEHRYLSNRAEGVLATVVTWLDGSNGQIWFVEHQSSNHMAVYSVEEMEPA